MYKNLRLMPILASVRYGLCMALGASLLAHGSFAADATIGNTDSYHSVYDYAANAVFTVDYAGDAVENFPLYLTIEADSPKGFSYTLLKNGLDDLTFFDSTGRALDYEIEGGKLNTAGQTRFWVRIPVLKKGATVTMCWNLRDGCTTAENNPTGVWSDYVGVWHMDETITSATAANTYSSDATGNGLDIVPKKGSKGDLNRTVSTVGVFGNARVNDTTAAGAKGGNGLFISGSEGLQFNGVFTLSFWLKFDSHKDNWPQLVSGRYKSGVTAGVQVDMNNADHKQIVVRGDGGGGTYTQVVDQDFDQMGFVHLAFVYDGSSAKAYANGVLKIEETVTPVTTNLLTLGNNCSCDEQSVYGKFDEVRLFAGARGAAWPAADYAQGLGALYVAGTVSNDTTAVLKNGWESEPTMTKTTWDADGTLPNSDDFSFTPKHNAALAEKYFYDRATGELLGVDVPKKVGEYRVVFTVAEANGWGALEYSIDFRIVSGGGTHDFGDSVGRVLLANDDDSIEGGEVTGQSYNDELQDDDLPYWNHLADDRKTDDSSTTSEEEMDDWSVSAEYNFGGGTYHEYWYRGNRLWTLDGVRIGNTFPRNDRTRGTGGLAADHVYLPWNEASLRVVNFADDEVGQWRRYVGQMLLQNKEDAQIVSSCYTNGIGTIYFDVANGWTNVLSEAGERNYQIVVEIATNCVGSAAAPTDEAISSNPEMGSAAYDQFLNANWQPVPMRVLRFDGGGVYTDLGTREKLNLEIEKGGTCSRFYRVYVPLNVLGNARFRIRRTKIDEERSRNPDAAFILVDNLICSKTSPRLVLEPIGRYDATKTGKEVVGYEGSFVPALPSMTDEAVYGRAKARMADGSPIPDGFVAAAAMHYRWHYLEQKETGERVADLNLSTFTTAHPLELPLGFAGDVEFWFEANQNGHYYEYADYSGQDLGVGGYSEEVKAVTNGVDSGWFVRTREGTSSYAGMKLVVKESENGTPEELGMWVSDNHLWRGFYKMDKYKDAKEDTEDWEKKEALLKNGIWWRIEPRDRQEDGATSWNAGTNYWYVEAWKASRPDFPAAGRMSEGDTNSWSRMPCDMQTGYLMFQADESSHSVTVIHADYQNFNDWNDASGYFTGSSAETDEMSGTSSKTKTYTELYKNWAAAQPENEKWNLSLTNQSITASGDWEGYKMFSGKSPIFWSWDVGKGMWVYGKYREPDSHVAYQMAGCGEGWANFVQAGHKAIEGKDIWPRGIESVSFQARLAQEISPAKMACFADGMRLKDYTFMTRACFDMKRNEGFAGNAALSLFAYYRESKGCYEARWEQIQGKATTNTKYPTSYLGPTSNGQRLLISRWDRSGDAFVETPLFAVTNSALDNWKFNMPLMPYDNSSATNNLMPFLISVFKEGDKTIIAAAVRVTAKDEAKGKSGVSWNTATSEMSGNWYYAYAIDDSSKQLTSGTYGVLSSNCEGLFLTPEFKDGSTYPSDTTPAKMLDVKSVAARFYSNTTLNGVSGFEKCYDDIADDWWEINPGREAAFLGPSASTQPFGFAYVARSQVVKVMTSEIGKNTWTEVCELPVTDFGAPYEQPNCSTNLYLVDDCELRLQSGGTLSDYRTDVVISDVKVRQWRGRDDWTTSEDDWDFTEDTHKSKSYNYFGATNIVFTSGWVTNDAVRISARRTKEGVASSVRSPLFDGLSQEGASGMFYRSVGLGQIGFRYRNVQANAHIKIQILTNCTDDTAADLADMSRLPGADGDGNRTSWATLADLTYADLMTPAEERTDGNGWNAQKQEGAWSISLGWHGAQGMMRVVVDDELVKELADKNETDVDKFGEIDILELTCKDEPALDKGCWWGWNLKTVGDFSDTERRMYLPDGTRETLRDSGQALALNNSTSDGTNPAEDEADFKKHLPFLQSPTFTNGVIGQVTFKVRKFENSDIAPDAKVVIYGAEQSPNELEDSDWKCVAEYPVTNTLYSTYTCKATGAKYFAVRLAVLIPGTTNAPPEVKGVKNPQRILIDEVMVSEAVTAQLAFRNVGAFRSDLKGTGKVPNVPSSDEQPLCDENWGIQAELMATMLEDELVLTEKPNVRLHWYVGEQPWGYENWKDVKSGTQDARGNPIRGSAELAQADGSNLVYRSSYKTAPGAVLPAQYVAGTVVQYMLEVDYVIKSTGGSTVRTTNWLDSAAWTTPDWYAPIDFNKDAQHGAGKTFAAYSILDKVAPGWAWINESNTLGAYNDDGENLDQNFQYVEVCVPMDADLTGWQLRFLSIENLSDDVVTTNLFATFGPESDPPTNQAPATKTGSMGAKYGKVFRCLGNKVGDHLKKENGTLDGVWEFSEYSTTFQNRDGVDCVYDEYMPFGIQLVRPSGIIESSVVVIGTNYLEREYQWYQYSPTNIAARLNKLVPGSKFFCAGEDCCGAFRSLSVTDGQGESASVWANDWACSPGYINTNVGGKVEQKIALHPSPHGDSVVVYAEIDQSGGPIRQWVGGKGSLLTNQAEMIVLAKGGPGTNILYQVDPWYELASVTTNEKPFWAYTPRTRYTNIVVGAGASENMMRVVAKAGVDSKLRDYGLTADNPYTPAVMDWLVGGTTLRRDADGKFIPFANDGEIALADYVSYNRRTTSKMTLTQMYWLDMDPTVSNLEFRAGMIKVWPETTDPLGKPVEGYEGQNVLTNVKMRVYMAISNRHDHASWSPYILRGLDSNFTSWDYALNTYARQWTSETFQVTGILANGLTSEKNTNNWVALRWFVFDEDSFRQDEGDLKFTTDVEIEDPHSATSPGRSAGWYDWCQKHGYTPVFNSWRIDTPRVPVGVEVLGPTNFYPKGTF